MPIRPSRHRHGERAEPMFVYKVLTQAMWAEAQRVGAFAGSPVDLRDGFIHLSAAEQVEETVRLHFGGQADLVLVRVAAEAIADGLKWEPSRGGKLFPHLFGTLPLAAIESVAELPMGEDGFHRFPVGWGERAAAPDSEKSADGQGKRLTWSRRDGSISA